MHWAPQRRWAKGALTPFFARHPWALDRRHPWRLTVRRKQHPSPPRSRLHPFAGTCPLPMCSHARLHRIARKRHRMRDETMCSVDGRGAGSVRRTVRRHGWRRSSDHGWLERVRRTDPAPRPSPPTCTSPRHYEDWLGSASGSASSREPRSRPLGSEPVRRSIMRRTRGGLPLPRCSARMRSGTVASSCVRRLLWRM